MIPESVQHYLDLAPRTNYARTYTAGHNVRELFIGQDISDYRSGLPSSISSSETEYGIGQFSTNQYCGYSSERQNPPTQYNSPFMHHFSTNFNNHNPTVGLASHFPDHQHNALALSIDPERTISLYVGNKTYHSHLHGRTRNDTKDRSSRQTSPFQKYDDRSNGDASLDSHSILRGSAVGFVPTTADPRGQKIQDSVGLQGSQDFTNLRFKRLSI
ncbi:putative tho complex subunit 2 protein [Botrytis fragariae]|uniref:Putative tho complex subunit 2 protein n=1 Tax=Botrytis fragariae TaxID=1964551 RepID=A0A8H6AXG4_9HELO|nr:putative tho complex subunit 2 protein [Botrytis fragariae]KAF5875352.1 putative tho complex subunit 2 protein [Botrytis fragariae]